MSLYNDTGICVDSSLFSKKLAIKLLHCYQHLWISSLHQNISVVISFVISAKTPSKQVCHLLS